MTQTRKRPLSSLSVKRILNLAMLIALPLLSGCEQASHTRLRLMNALSGTSSVDLLVDTSVVASGIAYGASSPYTEVNAGSRQIAVNIAGTTTSLLTSTQTLTAKTDTTYVILGSSGAIRALILADDNSAPDSGFAKLRIIQASTLLGLVDVYVTAPGVDLKTVDATVPGLAFQGVSTYQSLEAGDYQVRFTLPGTKVVLLDSGSVTFNGGQISTAVALDPASGSLKPTVTFLADAH